MIIDTERLFEIDEIINRIDIDNELDFYHISNHQAFLNHFSFSVDLEYGIFTYFNDDFIPYDDYTNNHFSRIPITLLTATDSEVELWVTKSIEELRKSEEEERLQEIEILEKRIKLLKNE